MELFWHSGEPLLCLVQWPSPANPFFKKHLGPCADLSLPRGPPLIRALERGAKGADWTSAQKN